VGAASCRDTVFSFLQRRIRPKDGHFKTESEIKSLARAEKQGALR
jgi:hypothetical protein